MRKYKNTKYCERISALDFSYATHRGQSGKVFHDHRQNTIMRPYPSFSSHAQPPWASIGIFWLNWTSNHVLRIGPKRVFLLAFFNLTAELKSLNQIAYSYTYYNTRILILGLSDKLWVGPAELGPHAVHGSINSGIYSHSFVSLVLNQPLSHNQVRWSQNF